MLRTLIIDKKLKAEEIDKIVLEGVMKNFEITKSDISILPDKKTTVVTTDNSRTAIMLQRLFGFKLV